MKKRQMKKNQTKLLNNLLSLSSQLKVLEELGVYSVMTSDRMKNFECHIGYGDLIKLPFFDKNNLVFDKDWSYDTVEVSYTVENLKFFCLFSKSEFVKKFPEEVGIKMNCIVVNGVRYLKEVQTDE